MLELNIDELLRSAYGKCIETIKSNSRLAGQVATGKTLKSLEYTLSSCGAGYVARILGRLYFGSLETGRGAYKGGASDAKNFTNRLVEWLKARNIHCKDKKEYIRLANYLRWRINKFGTKLYQSGGRKDIFTPAVKELTEVLEARLVSFYEKKIKDMLTRNFDVKNKNS